MGVDPACFVAAGGMIGPIGAGPTCMLVSGDSFAPPADFVVMLGVVYPITFGFVGIGNDIVITGSLTDAGHGHPFTGSAKVIGVVGAAPIPERPCFTTPAVAYTLLVTATVEGL